MIGWIYNSYTSYGTLLSTKQVNLNPIEIDYSYIEYYKKAMVNIKDPSEKERILQDVKFHEGMRDYDTPSLRQINHLIQIDEKPNLELMEPKWELYKISISIQLKDNGKLYKIVTCIDHH